MNTPWSYGYCTERGKVVIRNGRGEVLMICVAPFAERVLAKRVCYLVNHDTERAYRAELAVNSARRGRGRPRGSTTNPNLLGRRGPRLPGSRRKP